MPDTQLVEDVGIVDGYVGQHDVGAVKLEEHVLADVASLHYLAGGAAAVDPRLPEGGRDQLRMHALKVHAPLLPESTDNESPHLSLPWHRPFAPQSCTDPRTKGTQHKLKTLPNSYVSASGPSPVSGATAGTFPGRFSVIHASIRSHQAYSHWTWASWSAERGMDSLATRHQRARMT